MPEVTVNCRNEMEVMSLNPRGAVPDVLDFLACSALNFTWTLHHATATAKMAGRLSLPSI